jgi:putative ABC transport system substrate-binding protein
MRRREFITLLGGAAAAWPLTARAQQPVIGFLSARPPGIDVRLVAAFRKGLAETGYVEGRNVAIEYRWAEGQYDRLSGLAADLVRRRVAVIVAPGSTPAALAAKAASTTIPIVFSIGGDPVQVGLVASLNRPGGNVTGVTDMAAELAAKQLGLLHELLPTAARFGVLINPNNPNNNEFVIRDAQAAATAIGRQIEILTASTNRDIDDVFAILAQKRVDALLIGPDALFTGRRVQLATATVRYAVPAIYFDRALAEAGMLMSYGSSNTDRDRLVGMYVGRILKGEKPVDLPVLRPTKFELVINLQTAKLLGIDVPQTLLTQADEVIE